MTQDTLPIEQDLNGNKIYLHGGLGGYISENIFFYAGISNLKISKLKQIQTPELYKSGYDTILAHGWYYIDTLYSTNPVLTDNEYTLIQNEFYLNANIALGNGIILTPAFHFLKIKYNSIYARPAPVSYYAQSYDTTPTVDDSCSIENFSTKLAIISSVKNPK